MGWWFVARAAVNPDRTPVVIAGGVFSDVRIR